MKSLALQSLTFNLLTLKESEVESKNEALNSLGNTGGTSLR